MVNKVDILAIGAHPDDVELSAAGTILKHVSLGKTVALLDLTEGQLGSRGSVQERYLEAANAAKVLGVQYRSNLKLQDGFFNEDEETLKKLITQIRRFQPEIVLANAPSDRHPDHARASRLVERACFLSGLLKIQTEWDGQAQAHWRPKQLFFYIQDNHLKPDFVVEVTPFKERKMEAILQYKTQFFNPEIDGPATPISGKDFLAFLEARMIEMGRCIHVPFAEGFISSKTFGVHNLFDIH